MDVHRDNELGYHFYPAPSREELDAHYEERYFQANDIYDREYSEEEIRFFRESSGRKIQLIQDSRNIADLGGLDVLEIGVGEGWGMAALIEAGAKVQGVDYTSTPSQNHNPQVVDRILVGQPEDILENLIVEGGKFDVVWMDNVLEHVPDPKKLLARISLLLTANGQMIIEVPNDFSNLQQFALNSGLISKPFWLAYPEHLSYFSAKSLEALLDSVGFKTIDLIGDFPIDLFLLNMRSNYVADPSTGKDAHFARLRAEHLLMNQPREDVINFYRSLAAVGLGRNLVNLSQRQSA